jgi:RNA polymerase sigma-70 factor (ECF subfamily)
MSRKWLEASLIPDGGDRFKLADLMRGSLNAVDGPISGAVDEGDRALIERLRQRDPDAVAELFDGHARQVRSLLARVLGPDQDLEDLFQEVFTRVLTRGPSLNGHSAPRAWLYGIAVTVAREEITRRRRRHWLRLPGTLPDPPAHDANWDARAAVRSFYIFLDEMPAPDRIPFAIRKLAGLGLQETAVVSGLSVSTLRRRLARADERFTAWLAARPALARWLGDEADFPSTEIEQAATGPRR